MNQIDIILSYFKKAHPYMGLVYLWDSCEGEVDYGDYPELQVEYDPDTAFFKALEVMLESGDQCLYYNSNCEDLALRSNFLQYPAEKQLDLLKQVWIGKEAMDKMDEENEYIGWWFLIYCPYGLAHKVYDEHGLFVKWHYD